MLPFIASVLVFLALATGAAGVLTSSRFSRTLSEERIRRLRPQQTARRAVAPTLRRPQSSIPTFRRFLDRSSWAEQMETQLEQANVRLRVGEYLLIRLLLTMIAFFVVALVTRFNPIGIVGALAAGIVVYMLPPMYLGALRRRRIAKIEKQLVELTPQLASSLRSGFALQQGIELSAQQLDAPIADELRLLISDLNLGATMDQALVDMGDRIGSPDIDMLVTAVLVQRTTGGNLAEILDQSAETLRERERIRGEIATLTAQQRLSGLILSVWPAGVGLILLALMPEVWSKLFTDTAGQVLLGIALGLQLVGIFILRRLMNVEI